MVGINTADCSKDNKAKGGLLMYRRLRDLREDSDLRQHEVAAVLHCSQQAYANYELGQRDIPTDILIALAQFYKTSTDYILGLTDDPTPPEPSKWLKKE